MANAGNLWDELRKFQQVLGQVQQQAANPRDRQVLGELAEHIKTHQAQAEEDLPKLLDHLKQQAQSFKKNAEEAQKQLAEAVKKAEAVNKQAAQREQLLKKPPAKLAAAAAVIDAHLGKKLQTELLAKFDQVAGRKQEAAGADLRDAWQDWSGFESQREGGNAPRPPAAKDASAPPAKEALPQPIAPPAAAPAPQDSGKLDDDVWQGLSRMDQSAPPGSSSRRGKDTKGPGALPPAKPKTQAPPAPPEQHAPPPPNPPEHHAPPPKPKHKPKESKGDDDDDIWTGLSSLEG